MLSKNSRKKCYEWQLHLTSAHLLKLWLKIQSQWSWPLTTYHSHPNGHFCKNLISSSKWIFGQNLKIFPQHLSENIQIPAKMQLTITQTYKNSIAVAVYQLIIYFCLFLGLRYMCPFLLVKIINFFFLACSWDCISRHITSKRMGCTDGGGWGATSKQSATATAIISTGIMVLLWCPKGRVPSSTKFVLHVILENTYSTLLFIEL